MMRPSIVESTVATWRQAAIENRIDIKDAALQLRMALLARLAL